MDPSEEQGAWPPGIGYTPNPDNPLPLPWPQPPLPWPDRPTPLPDDPVLPPTDWWCRFHGPVSGRYEGGIAGIPSIIGSTLELRVDVDLRYPNSPIMNRISGDFWTWRFQNAGRFFGRFRVFNESWIVDTPRVRWFRCRAEISGRVRYWQGTQPQTDVTVVIPFNTLSTGPATATFTTAGGSSVTYTCAYRSRHFRDVTLEADYCASVNAAPQLPSYDTTWHNDRPAGTPQRVLTVPEAYREAGIDLTIGTDHTVIDDSAAGFASWSAAELHDAMEVAFSQFTGGWPKWQLWGMLAGTYDSSTTGGIMFDAGAVYGGSGEPPERQGFAVFRNHSWFNSLVTGAPANQAQAAAMRHFLYTWVHEAGHAFNYLHSWNKGRPDALSWMNYDWKYDDRNGANQFWRNFRFRFDDEELLHIRHGDRVSVIMGGDAWATGGHLETPADAFAQGEGDPPLELLLRAQDYFDFMEPVKIEARLRNLTDAPLEIDARVTPESGNLTVFLRRPDGRIFLYAPIICELAEPQRKVLEPLAAGEANKGLDRHSSLVPLMYSAAGFAFDEPGEYLVRAIYAGNGHLATSNTLRLRIGRPFSRDEDRFAQDFFTYPVGMALYLEGSQSPFLAAGMNCLEAASERFAQAGVGVAAAAAIAKSKGDDFYRRVGDGSTIARTHEADPKAALKTTEAAVAYYRKRKEKELNLPYHQLMDLRAALHLQAGSPEAAKEELQELRSDLKARGVNPPVLASIKAEEERLVKGG